MQDTIMEPFKVLNELNVVKKNSFTLLYFVNVVIFTYYAIRIIYPKVLYLEDLIQSNKIS